MKIDIPLPCPRCGGKMYSVSYDAPLKVLSRRTWHVCKECNFTQNAEEFKKMLYCT
ncbi:MAG: hypothetical protein QW177_06270 [Candidatus Nitrosotenuis sp.]